MKILLSAIGSFLFAITTAATAAWCAAAESQPAPTPPGAPSLPPPSAESPRPAVPPSTRDPGMVKEPETTGPPGAVVTPPVVDPHIAVNPEEPRAEEKTPREGGEAPPAPAPSR